MGGATAATHTVSGACPPLYNPPRLHLMGDFGTVRAPVRPSLRVGRIGSAAAGATGVLDALIRTIVRVLLWLRYRVRVRGLEDIAARGTSGVLFLPNHPALIDPPLVFANLHQRFRPRALADRDQVSRPVIRWLARRLGVIPIPDIKVYGAAVRADVETAAQACVDTLAGGGNVLLYPSGHIYRTRYENLYGNSGAQDILRQAPGARVVLIRTTGLWGSSLSLAGGEYPHLGALLRRHLWNLARNFVFFIPRRDVTIELHEPADLPRDADRAEFNAYLERFYNENAPPNTQVAYWWGQRPLRSTRPEPEWERGSGALAEVPETVRQRVNAHLRELSGVETLRDDQRLAQDLGLDSLARAELLLWLAREFGCETPDGDAVFTVGDALLAACGETIVTRPTPLTAPPAAWFQAGQRQVLKLPPGETVAAAFLAAARRRPGQVIVADQLSGAKTYRDLITAILVLKPLIQRLEGERVGIMLPASVAASVAYWSTVFAGKTPVMVNWTTGPRNMAHSLDLAGVKHVLSAGPLVARLKSQGTDLGPLEHRLVLLEQLGGSVSRLTKLWALLRSYVSWGTLARAGVSSEAVVLVTSGSEHLPKAVPLTHGNLLTNIRDVIAVVDLYDSDRMLGFLPPFHSFGLTVTLVMPLVLGMRIVYHANPTEALTLARLIAAYQATIVLGTPTFLSGILRATSGADELASLRIAVTGAEKCPERTYEMLAERCPQATVLEGYGITECSPIVAANRLPDPKHGTVGRVLPSVEYVLVHPETGEPVKRGERGVLLVRGPSIFGGYLGSDTASPFVQHAGRTWYRTGDLLTEDADGVLTFRGRLQRFVKIGGEMVSLPAIEGALAQHYEDPNAEGPALAVVASATGARPELILFATRELDRQSVNEHIRAAGLSGLHNISRVVVTEEIPLLGNGKTDYRALEARLRTS